MPPHDTTSCPTGNTDHGAQPFVAQSLYEDLTPAQIEYWRVFFQLTERQDPEWMRGVRSMAASLASGIPSSIGVGYPVQRGVAFCEWCEVVHAGILATVEATPPNPEAVNPVKIRQLQRTDDVAVDIQCTVRTTST